MFVLKNWTLFHGYCYGNVFGNSRFPEGENIHTSKIVKLEVENEYLVATTKSGSHYKMSFCDISISNIEKIRDVLKDFSLESVLPLCEEACKEKFKNQKAKMRGVLEPKQLYLLTSGSMPIEGWYKKGNGKVIKTSVIVHSGMISDSVLVRSVGVVDFRVFPKNSGMDIYHWSDGLESVVIENIGEDCYVKGDKHILCKSGVRTVITNEDYSGEGLFSPDVVNGKSILRG